MPKRPESHVIGDQAAASVAHIVADCGWACEAVQKDYGEDLIVQTRWGDEVDVGRIWIQVKGTRRIDNHRTKKHGISRVFPLEHMLRWIRSEGLVVVVLWDVVQHKGFWSLPRHSLREWDILLQDSKPRLLFPDEQIFDIAQMQKIGWIARIDHYQRLIAQATYDDAMFYRNTEESPKRRAGYHSRITILAYEFLKMVDVIEDSGFSSTFWRGFNNSLRYIAQDAPDRTTRQRRISATILAFLACTNRATGLSMPEDLIHHCTNIILMLLDKADETSGAFNFISEELRKLEQRNRLLKASNDPSRRRYKGR